MAIVISNKRGQSLVEVMVSLTILAFVLAGSLTLIVTVVRLSLQARTKTRVVTYAQSMLAKIVSEANGGCLVADVTNRTNRYQDPEDANEIQSVSSVISIPEKVDNLSGFKKATVVVSWDDKSGGPRQTYTLYQLIRTAGE